MNDILIKLKYNHELANYKLNRLIWATRPRDERKKEIPNSKHEIRNHPQDTLRWKQIRIAKIQIFETKKEGENGGLNKAAGYQPPAASKMFSVKC
jgi:hypothetical protein